MIGKQLPLPGFDEPRQPSFMSQALVKAMCMRDAQIAAFNDGINDLREMGKMNDYQCPAALYIAQRAYCISLKRSVIELDALIDELKGKVASEN